MGLGNEIHIPPESLASGHPLHNPPTEAGQGYIPPFYFQETLTFLVLFSWYAMLRAKCRNLQERLDHKAKVKARWEQRQQEIEEDKPLSNGAGGYLEKKRETLSS